MSVFSAGISYVPVNIGLATGAYIIFMFTPPTCSAVEALIVEAVILPVIFAPSNPIPTFPAFAVRVIAPDDVRPYIKLVPVASGNPPDGLPSINAPILVASWVLTYVRSALALRSTLKIY